MGEPSDNMRRIAIGERRADPGMFRVIVYLGDIMYALGDDHPTLPSAVAAATGQSMDVQVYDDRGTPRLAGMTS